MFQFLCAIVFLDGILIGKFLNICIFPNYLGRSAHREQFCCMTCGYPLRWYDMIPLILGGKCGMCKALISFQYHIIEWVNGTLYLVIFAVNGFNLISVLYCLMASALLALSVIDFCTYEIPFGFNVFITCLGVVRMFLDLGNWKEYVLGFFGVSFFLELLLILSKGRAIGGGDVKLMAAVGLVIGWKLSVLAFFIGCILGSVIHIARMKISHAEHMLAMGPYLSMGIMIAALYGMPMIDWYFGILT